MYFDLFFEDIPGRDVGNDSESIYAIAKVTKGGDTLYHCHVTKEQYMSMIAEDPKLAKTASKLASKIFRKVDKGDGTNDDCPWHVFNGSIVDPEGKKIYETDNINHVLTDAEVAEMLYVETKTLEVVVKETFLEVLNGK